MARMRTYPDSLTDVIMLPQPLVNKLVLQSGEFSLICQGTKIPGQRCGQLRKHHISLSLTRGDPEVVLQTVA